MSATSTKITGNIMPLENIPDWEERLARQNAFWQGEIIDRPPVRLVLHRPERARQVTPPASMAERWLDVDYRVERALAANEATVHCGDSLPYVFPNLGPDVFSAFFGGAMNFAETTTWIHPFAGSAAELADISFERSNRYFRKLEELTSALLAAGKGKFYTGYADFHPGGDALSAMRGPENLAIDMLDNPDSIKDGLEVVTDNYLDIYDYFAGWLAREGQASCSWIGIVSDEYSIPSNDFSCMVSKEMFDEFFLPQLCREISHTRNSVYHLDGPGALQHLDSLLDVPELDAIQWVSGDGNGTALAWLHVQKRIQDAGKGVLLYVKPEELDVVMAELRPEGAFICIGGFEGDEEDAADIIRKVSSWR